VSRSIGEIRSELDRERRRLAASAVLLRDEVDRSTDLRRQLREHPMARAVAALLVLLTVSLLVSSITLVARSILGALRPGRARNA
jgi:hypothetical protein